MASSLPMCTIVNNTSLPGFFAATAMPDPDWWQALWPEPEKVFAALEFPSGLKVVDSAVATASLPCRSHVCPDTS